MGTEIHLIGVPDLPYEVPLNIYTHTSCYQGEISSRAYQRIRSTVPDKLPLNKPQNVKHKNSLDQMWLNIVIEMKKLCLFEM